MNLKLNIKELGKIKNSKIKLKPFTILFGESNTNKSYTLIANYFWYKVLVDTELETKIVENLEEIKVENINSNKLDNTLKDIFKDVKEVQKITLKAKDLKNSVIKVFLSELKNFYAYLLSYVPNLDLAVENIPNKFKTNDLLVDEIHIYFSKHLQNGIFYSIAYKDKDNIMQIILTNATITATINITIGNSKSETPKTPTNQKFKENFKNILLEALDTHIYKLLIPDIDTKYSLYFLPPSRGSIIDLQNSILFLSASNIPYPGIIKEFLKTYLPEASSPFIVKDNYKEDKVLRELMESILQGDIKIDFRTKEINYNQGKINIPILATASSIKEMAPLYLVLRNNPIEQKIFFIEEPEAHLHPYLQKKIAYLLAYIVNKGGKVYITTHSDYLVNTISNLVKIWYLKKKNKEKAKAIMKKYNIKEEFLINPKKLGVYFFNKNEKEEVKIEEIKPSENGISPESFLKVMEEDIELSQDILEAFAEVEE